MNFSTGFYLFTIANILIISFIRIGEAAGDDSDPEISELELQERRIRKGKWPAEEQSEEYKSEEYSEFELRENSENKGKRTLRPQYDSQETKEKNKLFIISQHFQQHSAAELQTALNELQNVPDQQKLNLCRRVWCAHVLKQDPNFEKITKHELEKLEESYVVKKIGNSLLHTLNVNVHSNKPISVDVLGCELQDRSWPNSFQVFIIPYPGYQNTFYVISCPDGFCCIVGLVDNIELPQSNDSQLIKTFKSLKTYWGGKK